MATRDRDLELTGEYFPALITGKVFPSRPLQARTQVKWIGLHTSEAPTESAVVKTVSRSDDSGIGKVKSTIFLQNWSAFLDHFSNIEDARFKVKEANFDNTVQAVVGAAEPTAVVGAGGRARIAFHVIGRDAVG